MTDDDAVAATADDGVCLCMRVELWKEFRYLSFTRFFLLFLWQKVISLYCDDYENNISNNNSMMNELNHFSNCKHHSYKWIIDLITKFIWTDAWCKWQMYRKTRIENATQLSLHFELKWALYYILINWANSIIKYIWFIHMKNWIKIK